MTSKYHLKNDIEEYNRQILSIMELQRQSYQQLLNENERLKKEIKELQNKQLDYDNLNKQNNMLINQVEEIKKIYLYFKEKLDKTTKDFKNEIEEKEKVFMQNEQMHKECFAQQGTSDDQSDDDSDQDSNEDLFGGSQMW